MKRLSIITLIFLLFLCGWSGVLASTFCPHIGAEHACCLMNKDAHDSASHHSEMAMDGMKMELSPSSAAAENEIVNTVRQDLKTCEHCAGSPQRGTAPLITTGTFEPSRRIAMQASLLVSALHVSLASTFAPQVLFRQSAPPGPTYSRHVLINVFRI